MAFFSRLSPTFVVRATNTDQRKWRQMHISAVSTNHLWVTSRRPCLDRHCFTTAGSFGQMSPVFDPCTAARLAHVAVLCCFCRWIWAAWSLFASWTSSHAVSPCALHICGNIWRQVKRRPPRKLECWRIIDRQNQYREFWLKINSCVPYGGGRGGVHAACKSRGRCELFEVWKRKSLRS